MKGASVIVVAAVGAAAVFAFIEAERYSSTTAFCTMCHSMSFPAAELKGSSHFAALGADPECGDCHLPPDFIGRMRAHIVSGV
ncbi:MAG: NapC/NirT family cytochrome c, partial [Thermodesulfobacteriota bacterium]